MAFFSRKDIGRVYIIRMDLPDDTVVHKIGMTHTSRSTDRMMEILRSWFTRYRFVPHSRLVLDMECMDPQKLEQYIHKILKVKAFIPNEKVSGGTEMFTGIDEGRVIWFLKAYNSGKFTSPPKLTDEEGGVICKLLSKQTPKNV